MIKYNHKQSNITRAMGITEAREALLDMILPDVMKDPNIHSLTEHIAEIERRLPRLTSAEYVYIGLQVGGNMVRAKMVHEMKEAAGEAMMRAGMIPEAKRTIRTLMA